MNAVFAGRSFDRHRPPERSILDHCVHCGFCLTNCPTYIQWGEEMDSPRGRISLMQLVGSGQATLTDSVVGHFDNCLGCLACVPACPSGVRYDRLIESTRAQIERNVQRPLADRLFRWLLFTLFPYPRRLRRLAPLLLVYRRSGLRALAAALGFLQVLPPRLRALEALSTSVVPRSRSRPLPARIAARGKARLQVGLLTGCVQQAFFEGVNRATARVLRAEGCVVIVPAGQECCGALELHAGEERSGLDRARRLIDAFEKVDVDVIAVNAAGCGSVMKEYGYLLQDDPRWRARAETFSAKVRDVSELLATLDPQATYHPIEAKVVYQDACHLRHAQGIRDEPRSVLRRISGIELQEPMDPDICCGSAGIYNLLRPDVAEALGESKATSLLAVGPQAIATANPGCVVQLRAALSRLETPLPVVHLVELLDASIAGRRPSWARKSTH